MKKVLYILIFLALALALLPFISWQMKTSTPLEVLIIDYTIPDFNYREHKGIVWGLNHFKYVKEDDSEYQLAEDYLGFYPKRNGAHQMESIDDRVLEAELIYLADTYGVYESDLADANLTGERSELIFGGLSESDVEKLERAVLTQNKTLIAEFNAFASPTENAVRRRFTSLMGIHWDGWIGRYFDNLDTKVNNELPTWMIDNYEEQTKQSWDFDGAGLVFVRSDDYIIVLEEGTDFEGAGVEFKYTDLGEDKFRDGLNADYGYWFDVIETTDADTLATYTLGLTEQGEARLVDYNISNTIPAVTMHKQNQSSLYYFAGDYADVAQTPSYYQFNWLDQINKVRSQLQLNGKQEFYYRAYLPMLETILNETKERVDENFKESTLNESIYDDEEIAYSSRISGEHFEVYRNGQWEKIDVKGINMGMAAPGYWPGEAAITFEQYTRWIEQISELGANVIRVYTIHPPAFYQALWLHNQKADYPIYLMHGVWIEEEGLEDTLDAFLPEHIEAFEQEMKDVVDVIHGNITLPEKVGHASGEYAYDISPYMIGWVLGIEWYPLMVDETNNLHELLEEFNGEFFVTDNANAFEKWLAARMETLIKYQVERYEVMQPISFTNWPTTDLLTHPAEPSLEEDLVSINPNHIHPKQALKTGYFASYHVYPYYPDFLNYEPDYIEYIDHRGQPNIYAGYLNDLIRAHEMPVLIAEFGVPASRGMTHTNPFGLNQGFHSEKRQGEIVVQLFEDIMAEGALGGLMFTWQDEWFKRTWNTMQLDNPDRRPYWSNVQTNEQRFGLLSFETHKKPIDGNIEKWLEHERVASKETGVVQSVSTSYDEAFIYVMIEFDPELWDSNTDLYILLNTIDNQGNDTVPFLQDTFYDQGVDFVVEVASSEESRVWIDDYYDPFYYEYGYELGLMEQNETLSNNNGHFNKVNFALNRPMTIPSTGEELPFEFYETGQLLKGNGNPESEDYHSLSDYMMIPEAGVFEIRLPWLLLNVKDPSLKEITGDLWEGGLDASTTIADIDINITVSKNQVVVDQLPEALGNVSTFVSYEWEPWEQPDFEERLKKSYDIIQEYLRR